MEKKEFAPTVKLSNGSHMPMIGLGTWKAEKGEVKKAVKHAIKIGYRHIDCASNYLNEDEVGDALSECFEEGLVKREDIFVTGKLNNPYHHDKDVEPHLDKTLKDLKLEYLDLWLMHWPVAFHYVPYDPNRRGFDDKYDPDGLKEIDLTPYGGSKIDMTVSVQETWRAMERMFEKGKVKQIGVCNFSPSILHDLLTYAKIKPAVLQIEMHVYLQQPKTLKYCQDHKIQVEAYSPLGTSGFKSKDEPNLLKDEKVKEIADKHKKTTAQVCLRFLHQRGVVAIPKSVHNERIEQNFDIFDFKLSEEEMKKIESFDKRHRFLRPFDWYQINLFDDN